MCRFVMEPDEAGTLHPTAQHDGICQNAVWFDWHDDCLFLCRHPQGETDKPPMWTATLSPQAWQDVVAFIGAKIGAAPG